ncbi:MAG: hypothetical protein ACYC27_15775 [Armatimonadota bacterium]
MKSLVRYVAYAYILFHLAGAALTFKYFNEFTYSPELPIMVAVWHFVNVIIWVGIIRHNRVCYWICMSLMILYCIVGVTGLAIFIMGNPQPYDKAIPVVFIGSIAAIGHYVVLLDDYLQVESLFLIFPLILIVLSALPLSVLILERRSFMHKNKDSSLAPPE